MFCPLPRWPGHLAGVVHELDAFGVLSVFADEDREEDGVPAEVTIGAACQALLEEDDEVWLPGVCFGLFFPLYFPPPTPFHTWSLVCSVYLFFLIWL